MAVWGVQGVGEEQEAGSDGLGMMRMANPVGSSALVTLQGTGYGELSVYDLAGRRINSLWTGNLNGEQILTWDTSGLSTGIYLLTFRLGESIAAERVTVIR